MLSAARGDPGRVHANSARMLAMSPERHRELCETINRALAAPAVEKQVLAMANCAHGRERPRRGATRRAGRQGPGLMANAETDWRVIARTEIQPVRLAILDVMIERAARWRSRVGQPRPLRRDWAVARCSIASRALAARPGPRRAARAGSLWAGRSAPGRGVAQILRRRGWSCYTTLLHTVSGLRQRNKK
jgi:hypothetical protein